MLTERGEDIGQIQTDIPFSDSNTDRDRVRGVYREVFGPVLHGGDVFGADDRRAAQAEEG